MAFVYEKFDSVLDYARATERPIAMRALERASLKPNETWNGGCGLDEARRRVYKGFARGTEHAKQILMKITPYLYTVKSNAPKYLPGVVPGSRFILDNYLAGSPELMYSRQNAPSKKFVSIMVNLSASVGVDAEIMFNRGATMIALIQALEQHRYRVAVKCCFGIQGGKYALRTVVNIKDYHQRMEIDRLAFFLADPSAFRRLYFSYMETQELSVRNDIGIYIGSGYGSPAELDGRGFKDYKLGDKDIYLGCASLSSPQWHTIEGCIKYLKETLRRYGIEMRGVA